MGDAAEQDALTAFNHMVRDKLPQALIASTGPVGLHYWHAVAMFLFSAYGTDIVDLTLLGTFAQEELLLRWRVLYAVRQATAVLGWGPLSLAMASKWCGCCAR